MEGKVCIVNTNCVPRGSRGLTSGAEIPVLTLHTQCWIRPFSLLHWFSKDLMEVDTKSQRPVQLFKGRKRTECRWSTEESGERRVPWVWLQDHCPFSPLHILLRACTPPQVPLSRCFWRLSLATAVMSRWAAEGWGGAAAGWAEGTVLISLWPAGG